ncbi:MAG: transporter [Myxococcales bacterium]|nr:transporter [Myxococcales bacterium]
MTGPLSRIGVIAWKELHQLRRDRPTLAMMLVLPVMQLLLFGYAINTDVRHIPMVVYDQDHTAASRDLARSMEATTFYDRVGNVRDHAEIEHAFKTGEARVALVIPPRFGSDVTRRRPTQIQLVVDGTDPQTVGSATNTAAALVASRSAERAVIEVEPATWYNPELRTAVFVVPGLVGVILTMTMVMLTAMAIVRERERGTLEQLIVSPVRSYELVLGKIVPFVIVGYVQVTLILLAGRVIFDVPFAGSIMLLYALAFVFIAANLALGLTFSTIARTQQQAMQMSFFFLLPNILLSGFMFPFDAMPHPAQVLGQALPLTHFLQIVRGIALKDAGLVHLTGELVALLVILGALLALTSLRFRKRLD